MFRLNSSPYFVLCTIGMAAAAATLVAADPRYIPPTKNAQSKAEIERKVADAKRKIEQSQRDMKAEHQRAAADMVNVRNTAGARSAAPAFDPEGAPPPDESLWAFIDAAKNATSMEQLLPFLPQREQEILKSRQARFDPAQAAKNRDSIHKQNPKLTDEQLAHFTTSPFVSALNWHKEAASSIIRVMGVKVDGAKATVTVSTHRSATINGERYDYGEADVKMVGEGRAWKLAGFEHSIIVYKQAP